MKAAVLKKVGDISINEVEMPVPGHEEAVVKVIYAGICGTDHHVFSGHHPSAKIPVILGHEFVGTLTEINSEKNKQLKVGDDVLVQPYRPCGVCDPCIQGRDNVCSNLSILGVHENGCFAEYVKVPVSKIFKLPDHMDHKLAVMAEPLAVGVHDVRISEFQVGQTAFVIGGGPIGIMIALVARLNGATAILISEPNQYRAEFASKLGFNVINPTETDAVNEAMAVTNGKGFDVVFEVSGSRQGAALMTKVVKTFGTIVIVGVPTDVYPVETGKILAKELVVKGVRVHSQINFATAIEIMKKGLINDELLKCIDSEFALTDIKEAIKFSIEDTRHFKVIVKV